MSYTSNQRFDRGLFQIIQEYQRGKFFITSYFLFQRLIKEACYKAIKSVIKGNPANFHSVSADVFKSIQKYLTASEKSSDT